VEVSLYVNIIPSWIHQYFDINIRFSHRNPSYIFLRRTIHNNHMNLKVSRCKHAVISENNRNLIRIFFLLQIVILGLGLTFSPLSSHLSDMSSHLGRSMLPLRIDCLVPYNFHQPVDLYSIYVFVPFYFSLMYSFLCFFYIWLLMSSLSSSSIFPEICLNILISVVCNRSFVILFSIRFCWLSHLCCAYHNISGNCFAETWPGFVIEYVCFPK